MKNDNERILYHQRQHREAKGKISTEEFAAAMDTVFGYAIQNSGNIKSELHDRDSDEIVGVVIISPYPEDAKQLSAAFDVVEHLHQDKDEEEERHGQSGQS